MRRRVRDLPFAVGLDRTVDVIMAEVRNKALEEAARACLSSGANLAEARLCAAAIRALKAVRQG